MFDVIDLFEGDTLNWFWLFSLISEELYWSFIENLLEEKGLYCLDAFDKFILERSLEVLVSVSNLDMAWLLLLRLFSCKES